MKNTKSTQILEKKMEWNRQAFIRRTKKKKNLTKRTQSPLVGGDNPLCRDWKTYPSNPSRHVFIASRGLPKQEPTAGRRKDEEDSV